MTSAARLIPACSRRGRRALRRGLTFIEVVIATAMLTALASIVLGSVTFLDSSASRHQHRLNATEVAHRLIVQFIDDPGNMPEKNLPIQQGTSYYRWELVDEVVMQEDSGDSVSRLRRGRAMREDQIGAEQALTQMLKRVSVRVYLDDPGNTVIRTDAPVATLSRIFNPVSERRLNSSLDYLIRMMDRIESEKSAAPGGGAR